MTKKNIQDIYPLSPMQQGMLFHSLLEPNSGAYIIQISYELHGQLNISAFAQAWQQIIDRHSILRTAFVWDNLEQPLQVVGKTVKVSLIEHDWQHIPLQKQPEKLAIFLQEQRTTGFNLNKAPLMSLNLIKMQPQVYQFIWANHHLLLDGWSMPLLIKELLGYYQGFAQNQNIAVTQAIPYKNYINWLKQQDQEKAHNFWREQLKDFNTPTVLGISNRSTASDRAEKNYLEQNLQLSTEITYKLEFLAREYKLTLNNLVQGAWAILLHRYSDEKDLVFGATSSGRPPSLANSQSMVGLFINTLPVRVQINSQQSLIDWLKQIQTEQLARQEYEFTSLIDIHRVSDVPKDLPLFQSIVIFENYPVESGFKQSLDALYIRNIKISEQTNYPLTLYAAVDSQLSFKLLYNTNLFAAKQIRSILEHLRTLLESIASNPRQKVGGLNILTAVEQQKLLASSIKTAVKYPQDACFHELFTEQAAKTPTAIAATYEGKQITYQELNHQADILANYLQTLGVRSETLVGICIDRSLEMIVGLLAILKAGGAYIPLDPNYPPARLDYIVKDSQLNILLAETKYRGKLNTDNLTVIEISSQPSAPPAPSAPSAPLLPCSPAPLLPCPSTPENLAYVIYTSGSTGKPKGVQITHRSLVNFLYSLKETLAVSSEDILLSVTTISFDIAALELYLPLLVGGTIEIASAAVAIDSEELATRIEQDNITIMQATPATWRMLVANNWSGNQQLKILSGGEALEPQLAKQLITKGKEVWNLYGPTETTIWSSIYQLERDRLQDFKTIPLGKAIANTQLYVLDSQLRLAPPGVVGELYIGGAGLARGYLNRPDLTAERFIPNPFAVNSQYAKRLYHKGTMSEGVSFRNPLGQLTVNSKQLNIIASRSTQLPHSPNSLIPNPQSLIYKTGDRVRYNLNGDLEYLGRVDNQVKIHGFRIELGEIATVLSQHPEIDTAVVVTRGEGTERKLVAYILPQQDKTNINAANLRSFLQSKLPNYMIPGNYVMLEQFPLTPNGKIDRANLPELDTVRPSLDIAYQQPRTEIERSIAQIWQQILQVEQVGAADNFFDLGGHSLSMIRVHSQVKEMFSVDISLVNMFRYPTIASLAEHCNQVMSSNRQPIVQLQKEDTTNKNLIQAGKSRLKQRLQKRMKEK